MPPALTRALVARHGAGRADTYGAALLDVAQDHLLWLLDQEGLFAGSDLIFKGGMSLEPGGPHLTPAPRTWYY